LTTFSNFHDSLLILLIQYGHEIFYPYIYIYIYIYNTFNGQVAECKIIFCSSTEKWPIMWWVLVFDHTPCFCRAGHISNCHITKYFNPQNYIGNQNMPNMLWVLMHSPHKMSNKFEWQHNSGLFLSHEQCTLGVDNP